MFLRLRYSFGMPDTLPLRPALPDEIADALAFALQFDGRRRVHQADRLMAKIAANHLVRHLERSGFVVMKKPPGEAPTTARMPPATGAWHRRRTFRVTAPPPR